MTGGLPDALVLAASDGHARYVPDLRTSEAVRDLHESRYAWVTETFDLSGARVLDLGCGSGYGSRHLASAASEVVAADISASAIAYAQHRYPAPNIRHVPLDPGDRLDTTPGIAPVDLVMSAEVLEHVRNPFAHMADIVSVVAETGVAVVCTPNRWFRYTRDRGGLLDPSHVMELTPDALVALVSGWFAQVDLWFQVWPPAAVVPEPPAPVRLPRRLARGTRRAVASFAAEVRPGRGTTRAHDDGPAGQAGLGIGPLSGYRSRFVPSRDATADPPPGAVGLVAVGRGPRGAHGDAAGRTRTMQPTQPQTIRSGAPGSG